MNRTHARKAALAAVLALCFVTSARPAYSIDDVTTLATLSYVKSVRLDSARNLWVLMRDPAHQLRKFPAPVGSAPSVLVSSNFVDPVSLAMDSQDNMYIPEYNSTVCYKVTPTGTRTTFATGITQPSCVAVDAADNVYVGEILGGEVWKITPGGTKTLYGDANLQWVSTLPPTLGQGESRLGALAFDRIGNLYCSGYGPNGGGTGVYSLSYIPAGGGTGVQLPPVPAPIMDFALGPFDNFYTAGYQNSVLGSITMSGSYMHFAGTGTDGFLDGPRASARFNWPSGLALDNVSGVMYIADYSNNRVRVLNSDACPLCPTPGIRTSWGRVKSLYHR